MTTRIEVRLMAAAVLIAFAAPALASRPAPDRATARYEVRFMTEMIDHHAMAVEMAQLCLSRAVHHELRATCENIISSQQHEIATMQSWLRHWYNVTYSPQMTPGMQRQLHQMAAMSGEEFEIAFLKEMIQHHWKAVIRASGCIDRAYHHELVALCAQIVEAQTAEITQMRTWLCHWYHICHYGPKGAVARRH